MSDDARPDGGTDRENCKTDGCTRDPFDSSGYCGTCLNYIDGTYTLMTDGGTEQSYSFYELRAVYAIDHGSGARIEQMVEGTAPSEYGKEELKQVVADATGRMRHDIEELDVINAGVREHVETAEIVRIGQIELGGVR